MSKINKGQNLPLDQNKDENKPSGNAKPKSYSLNVWTCETCGETSNQAIESCPECGGVDFILMQEHYFSQYKGLNFIKNWELFD